MRSNLCADTLTVMHYNLMYYDREYNECTSITNNVDSKDGYLRTIAGYIRPDILTVNELNSSTASSERILTNALNINGETRYRRANSSGSFLSNMIYYNSDKLALKSQTQIATSPRITDVYRLYLKTESLPTGDTIFLTCLVAHLKAGNTDSDKSQRANAAKSIMRFVADNNITGNILLMGDMNLYTSEEGAFVAFTTPTGTDGFRLYDPINRVGSWGGNVVFKSVHTQSTRTSSGGCFSAGGMDDRFDFILSSQDILNNSQGLKHFSYRAVGQDGNRFNLSLISPTNSSVPAEVLNALYNMSDHLPVEMKLTYSNATSSAGATNHDTRITHSSPAPGILRILLRSETETISSVSIYSITGQRIAANRYSGHRTEVEISTSGINSPLFIVDVLLSSGYRKTFKVLK